MKIRLKHEALRRRLERRAISQNRWAQILGISRGHLSLLAQGKRPYPTRRTRQKLMRGLGADFEELFELEEEKAPRRKSRRGSTPPASSALPGRHRGTGATTMRDFLQDLQWAWRGLAKRPGFALLATATVAVGIWSASAVFSIYDALWLRPLDFHEPSRLVQITEQTPQGWELGSLSDHELEYLERLHLFQSVAGYHPDGKVLTGTGEPRPLYGASVSPSLVSVLGVRPLAGRWFSESDAREGAPATALISHRLWQSRFGGRKSIVGQSLVLDDVPHEVIGVMPAGFQFPVRSNPQDLWFAKRMYSQGGAHSTRVVARLMPGQAMEQARRDLRAAFRHIDEEFRHEDPSHYPLVTSLHEKAFGRQRPVLNLLMASVLCLLLIAGANFASLLLLRGTRRRHELAVRQALGATAPRLAGHQVGEGLLLAFLGGIAGVLLCFASIDALRAFSPVEFPRLDQVGVDWRVVGFALAASLLCGLLFGFLPGIHTARRTRLRHPLQDIAHSPEPSSARLRSWLVTGQVALSVVLLVAAGLMLRSLNALLAIDPGMDPSHVLSFYLPLDGDRYSETQKRLDFMGSVLRDLRALPQVEAATLSEGVPLQGGWMQYGFRKAGEEEGRAVGKYVAGSGYFRTLGIPILRGREFTQADQAGSPQVAVINEAMARKFWDPPEQALGSDIVVESHPGTWRIVGIAGTVKRSQVSEDPAAEMYLPYTKATAFFRSPRVSLRSSTDPRALVDAVKERVRAHDAKMPLIDVRLLEDIYLDSMARPRFRSRVVAFFAALAVALTAVGLFGLLSYFTSQRRHEFGVRRALGARGMDLMALVARQGARTVLPGLALGLLAAWASARLLESFLYQVTPSDAWTFAAVPLLFLAVALAATLLPARRSTQVDPAASLRAE